MKLIQTGYEAKQSIKNGIDKVANIVKTTLGPTAHTVIMSRKYGSPVISDDGVTVAKEVEVENPFEQIGVDLIQEIASKTNETAGDGTTTATVIAQSIIGKAFETISFNSSKCAEIKAGMDKAVSETVKRLKGLKKDITTPEEIEQIATISSLDPELGKLISQMMEEVGKTGIITVEEGNGTTYSTEVVKGMQFDRGFISPYLAHPSTGIAELSNPHVLITTGRISAVKDIIPVLSNLPSKDILIIADDIEGEALNTLVINKLRGMLNVVAVRAPGHGDNRINLLEDIAALTGATLIDEVALKLVDANATHLGKAGKVTVTKDTTTIVDGTGPKLEERIQQIKNELPSAVSEYDKEQLHKRIARLTGGVGVIKVGAPTETEVRARKFKLEDALNATRAAVEEGVIPGGGSTLARLSPSIFEFASTLPEFEKLGATLIAESLTAPLLQLAENTGTNAAEILTHIQTTEDGYDFKKHTYGDLFQLGVIDPVKVTRLALENATSIASILITSEAVIVDKPKDEKDNGQEI